MLIYLFAYLYIYVADPRLGLVCSTMLLLPLLLYHHSLYLRESRSLKTETASVVCYLRSEAAARAASVLALLTSPTASPRL